MYVYHPPLLHLTQYSSLPQNRFSRKRIVQICYWRRTFSFRPSSEVTVLVLITTMFSSEGFL